MGDLAGTDLSHDQNRSSAEVDLLISAAYCNDMYIHENRPYDCVERQPFRYDVTDPEDGVAKSGGKPDDFAKLQCPSVGVVKPGWLCVVVDVLFQS